MWPKNNKTKTPAQRNSKPKDSVHEKTCIAQLENEVDPLKSTVELYKKNSTIQSTGSSQQQHTNHAVQIDRNSPNQHPGQIDMSTH